jgi:hypothetical protein
MKSKILYLIIGLVFVIGIFAGTPRGLMVSWQTDSLFAKSDNSNKNKDKNKDKDKDKDKDKGPIPVPEPSTLILLGVGLAAGGAYSFLRRQKGKEQE